MVLNYAKAMDNSLEVRRAQAEEKFNALAKQRDQKETEIKEIDTELARLQGEWRLLDDLIKEKSKTSKVSPKADVIDVETAVKEKK